MSTLHNALDNALSTVERDDRDTAATAVGRKLRPSWPELHAWASSRPGQPRVARFEHGEMVGYTPATGAWRVAHAAWWGAQRP